MKQGDFGPDADPAGIGVKTEPAVNVDVLFVFLV